MIYISIKNVIFNLWSKIIYQNKQIGKTSTFKLIFLLLLLFGIYWYVWLWKLITDINKLYPAKGKCIHRYNWFCTLIGLDIISTILDLKRYSV